MLILPRDLFLRIRNQLNPSFCDDLSFSIIDSELKNLKYLNMYKSDLKFVEYFTNLEMIEISGFPSITNEDLDKIFKCLPNLKKLIIKEQNELTSINFKKANSLIDLRIISNDNLVEINGLNNLARLKSFTFYDNQHIKNKQQIVDYIMSHNGKIRYSLDVNYYRDIQFNCYENNKMFETVEWVEYCGLRKHTYYAYDSEEMKKLASLVNKIICKYIYKNDSDMEKFVILYSWMINNIDFVNEDILFFRNDIGKLKGIYNTFKYLKGGRLSYAKAFQFLLEFAGIKSDIIYSLGGSDSIGIYNGQEVHSLLGANDYALLKVYINNKTYYCDVAWDSSCLDDDCYNELRLFLMDKEELLLRHRIVGEVNVNDASSIPSDDADDLLMYAKDRIKDVDRMISKLCQYDREIDRMNNNISFLEEELKDLRLSDTSEFDDELIEDEHLLMDQTDVYNEFKDKRYKMLKDYRNILCRKYLGLNNIDDLGLAEIHNIINNLLGLLDYNLYSNDMYKLLVDTIEN